MQLFMIRSTIQGLYQISASHSELAVQTVLRVLESKRRMLELFLNCNVSIEVSELTPEMIENSQVYDITFSIQLLVAKAASGSDEAQENVGKWFLSQTVILEKMLETAVWFYVESDEREQISLSA
jgi:hypothetical protein